MNIIQIIVILIICGGLLWLVDYIPWISADIKKVIHVIAIVLIVIWLVITVVLPLVGGLGAGPTWLTRPIGH